MTTTPDDLTGLNAPTRVRVLSDTTTSVETLRAGAKAEYGFSPNLLSAVAKNPSTPIDVLWDLAEFSFSSESTNKMIEVSGKWRVSNEIFYSELSFREAIFMAIAKNPSAEPRLLAYVCDHDAEAKKWIPKNPSTSVKTLLFLYERICSPSKHGRSHSEYYCETFIKRVLQSKREDASEFYDYVMTSNCHTAKKPLAGSSFTPDYLLPLLEADNQVRLNTLNADRLQVFKMRQEAAAYGVSDLPDSWLRRLSGIAR